MPTNQSSNNDMVKAYQGKRQQKEHYHDQKNQPRIIVWQACLHLGRCDKIAECIYPKMAFYVHL